MHGLVAQTVDAPLSVPAPSQPHSHALPACLPAQVLRWARPDLLPAAQGGRQLAPAVWVVQQGPEDRSGHCGGARLPPLPRHCALRHVRAWLLSSPHVSSRNRFECLGCMRKMFRPIVDCCCRAMQPVAAAPCADPLDTAFAPAASPATFCSPALAQPSLQVSGEWERPCQLQAQLGRRGRCCMPESAVLHCHCPSTHYVCSHRLSRCGRGAPAARHPPVVYTRRRNLCL